MIEQRLAKTTDELETLMKEGWIFKSAIGNVAIVEREKPIELDRSPDMQPQPPAFSDEEILFWSTPHFDELQARKQAIIEKRAEDASLRESHG